VSYSNWRSTPVGLPREAFRPSPIFLGILAVFVGFGALAWLSAGSDELNVFMFVVAGWLLSLCLHEYAHAVVAYRAGDYGVASLGYLRLNPLKYAHPFLSIVLPVLFILIGAIALPGGAVLVDNHRLRTRAQRALVSLAGPATNVVFAIVLLLPFVIGVNVDAHQTFWSAIALLAFFQISAAILNLLPVPGLDGGNAVYPYLNSDWKRAYDVMRPWGMLLLVVLLFYTVLRSVVFDVFDGIMAAANVPNGLAGYGLFLFQFWR
jgi:Zn-dependent protease